ncbi:enterochelin esterase [Microbulbifer aggregans]|uniref:enterochelin esterase n=1 Tax=Microbulbifer aggregans TaxID=1769779 RepID=UPI001CFE03D9|nr:enterochelin esterase [Microbulbifer aggregans]
MSALPCLEPLPLSGEGVGSDDWWRILAGRGLPLKTDVRAGEHTCTFFWRQCAAAEIETAFIEVNSHTPHPVREAPAEMQRITGTDIWYWQTRLPNDWCGSYFFLPAQASDLPMPDGGDRRNWWLDLINRRASFDPLNPVKPHNGPWGRPASGIYPQDTQWLDFEPRSALQKFTWRSERLNNRRNIWVYRTDSEQPRQALPLVMLLDGNYWHTQDNLLGELDQRTRSGDLPPAAYLMIDAIDETHRATELPCNTAFWLAIQQELLPQIAQSVSITEKAEQTLVVGQSYGGLAATWAALNWPHRFGKAFSQSGSFWWPREHAEHSKNNGLAALDDWVNTTILGSTEEARPEFLLEVGLYEPHMLDDNRALRQALEKRRFPTTYREVSAGHDWLCWRRNLVAGIAVMLKAS